MNEIYKPEKETYAIYTGPVSPRFEPLMAGITYPNPNYEILRPKSDIYVFEYVSAGRGTICQGSEQITVRAGDAYILTPGMFQHYYPDKQHPFQKIWFNVNGYLVRHLLSDYNLDTTLIIPGYGNSEHLQAILSLLENDPVHSSDQISILLHQYIQTLANFLGIQAAKNSLALSMKNYIEQNLSAPLDIDDIAAHVHLSRSRAIHLFRETYGDTPYNYYLSQRLERAEYMLQYTTLSIQEISSRLNFTDYHHFSSFFKKKCGLSPSHFRKQHATGTEDT